MKGAPRATSVDQIIVFHWTPSSFWGRAAMLTRGVTGPPLHLTDDPPIPPVSSRRPLCRASHKMVTAVVVVMAAVVLLDVVVGVVQ